MYAHKKMTLAAATALALSLGLVACGGGATSSATSQEASSAAASTTSTDATATSATSSADATATSATSSADATTQTAEAYVTADELAKPTVTIALGDFEGMGALAKDIQEFRNEGAIVQIDGYVSNFGKGMSYNIVEKNEDGSQSVGTTFVIEGVDEDAYPADGTHVQLTGKVTHSDTKSFLIIRTLPEFVVVQE